MACGRTTTVVHQVHDVDPPDQDEVIGEQSPVAAPPHRLAAHDDGCSRPRRRHQPVDAGDEVLRLHVVGVAAERLVAQRRVTRPGKCRPPAPESRVATRSRGPHRPARSPSPPGRTAGCDGSRDTTGCRPPPRAQPPAAASRTPRPGACRGRRCGSPSRDRTQGRRWAVDPGPRPCHTGGGRRPVAYRGGVSNVLSRNNVRVGGDPDGRADACSRTGSAATRTCGGSSRRAFEDRLPGRPVRPRRRGRLRPLGLRPPSATRTLDGYADDVLEICSELDLHDVDLRRALGQRDDRRARRGATQPERFGKLVLVGPSPRYIDDDGYVGGFSRGRHRRAARVAREQLPRLVERDGAGDHGQRRPARARRGADRELLPHGSRRSRASFARVTFLSDNRADLAARARARRWCCSARRRDRARRRRRVRARATSPGSSAGEARRHGALPQPERPRGDDVRGDPRVRRILRSPVASGGDIAGGLRSGAARRRCRRAVRGRALRVPVGPPRRHDRQGQPHVPAC